MGNLGKGKLGWTMPAGCSGPPDEEGPCEVCGQSVDHCICPECPKCGAAGDPRCYEDYSPGFCGGLRGKKTIDQSIGFARHMVDYLEEKILELQGFLVQAKDNLAKLEKIKACQEHAKKSGVECPGPDFCGLSQPCSEGCPGEELMVLLRPGRKTRRH